MTSTPLSPVDLDRLRAVARERWPACAEAQGVKFPWNVDVAECERGYQICISSGKFWPIAIGREVERARESLARALEGAPHFYAVARHGDARYVTGREVVDGRALADIYHDCAWDDRVSAHEDRLHRERVERDAPMRAAAGDPRGAKYEHVVAVNEMARRSKV
jgi:hypothetical protein